MAKAELKLSHTGTCESPYGDHLPIFPVFYSRPSEDRLERCIQRLFDRADHALLSGLATQEQYDRWSKAVDDWSRFVMTARLVQP